MKRLDVCITLACSLGILVSLYTLYVEYRKEHDKNYVAMCDFSESVACSKVFTSKYGKGFGLTTLIFGDDSAFNQKNPIYGIIYYVTMISLCFSTSSWATKIQLILTVISLAGCVWLGYVLAFILHDFCIVCASMYVVQTVIFILILFKRRGSATVHRTKKKN